MGQFNAMVSTSMVSGDVYVGRILATGVRAGIAGGVFLAVAAVLGGTASWAAPLAIVPTVLVAMIASAWLGAYSVRRDSDVTFSLIIRLGVIPLFLFSGTFFPIDQLPDVVEPMVWLSPLWHAVEPARDFTAGGVDPSTFGHLGVLVSLCLLAVPIGIRGFTARLTP